MKRLIGAFVIAGALVTPRGAVAQGTQAIDVGYEAFGTFWGHTTMLTVRVTLPKTERKAVEPFLTWQGWNGGFAGLYGFQVRRALGATEGSTQAFWTAGVAGAYSSSFVSIPLLPVVGAGFMHKMGDRLWVRADAQSLFLLIFPTARVSASIVVPLGS